MSSIEFRHFYALKIMAQNVRGSESPGCHDGCPDLAKADTVAPAGPVKDKGLSLSMGIIFHIHHKGTAIEVCPGKPAPYLELLPHDHASL